jgi:integrase
MYWEKRQNIRGENYYTFAYFDKNFRKNVRLKKSEIPSNILSDEAADKFCHLKDAELESAKMRVLKKLEWKKKFYDFDELLEIYKIEMQKRSPNNWQNSCYYLEQYAFPFFLSEKQSNNINNWSLFYQEFIDWLLVVKPSKGTNSSISYSTKNHVISALNNFIVIMKQKNKIERADKCTKFSKHLVPMRDIDDVYGDQEILDVTNRLNEKDSNLSDLFKILLNTGLRISECLAISIDDFYVGEPEHETLKKSLHKHDFKTLGYLAISSQLGEKNKLRNENGSVIRKPLKGRKRIKSGEGRIIPIIDRDTFNILATRYNAQLERLKTNTYGADGKNYLLFDGIYRNSLNSALSKIYTQMNGKYKSKCQHCCRHTFSTSFVGLTGGDFFLAKAILGHKDIETTMRYVHIFEAINRKVKNVDQQKTGIVLIS